MKKVFKSYWSWLSIGVGLIGGCVNISAQEVIAHDPVMIEQDGAYYLFTTGPGIAFYKSTDMVSWQDQGPVFAEMPEWIKDVVANFDGHIWAPDVYQANGQYYLYYSISAFGRNTSAIGVVTNKTLDKTSPDYKWQDHGIVVRSFPNRDSWNAIDPNIIQDDKGAYWMSFGSFWDGLKLVKMAPDLLSVAEPQEWYNIAKREPAKNPPGAIEAPFIYKRGDYYYQFVSWDLCCRGPESTYKVMVGRSKSVTGPYVDKAGTAMMDGGGSLVIEGDENWYGLGHNSIYDFGDKTKLVLHAYDAKDKGIPKLKIIDVQWSQDGWPEVNPQDVISYKSLLKE